MSKILVIYRQPADPAAFDDHYFNIHVPLAKTLPGLRAYDVSRGPITGRMSGDAPYMVATLHFDRLQDVQNAFASDIGKECAADVRRFAPNDGDSTMLIFEDETL